MKTRIVAIAVAAALTSGAPALAQNARVLTPTVTCANHPQPLENVGAQLAKFRTVSVPFSTAGLNANEVKMLRKLVEAGQYLESIYWRQSDPEGLALYQGLTGCPGAREQQIRHYL